MLNSSLLITPFFNATDTTLSNATNAGVMMLIKRVTFLTLLALGGGGGGGRRFPRKFYLPVDNFFSFGLIATKFGDFS